MRTIFYCYCTFYNENVLFRRSVAVLDKVFNSLTKFCSQKAKKLKKIFYLKKLRHRELS